MDSYKDKLILIALLVCESIWMFVTLGAVSIIAGKDSSPLNWYSIFLIMGSSMLLTQLGRIYLHSFDLTSMTRPLIGAFLIYILVGINLTEKSIFSQLMWIFDLRSYISQGFGYQLLTGVVLGIFIWWRGGKVSAVETPVFSLQSSFRVGLFGMAISTVVDITSAININVFPSVFVFFASGLTGLSLGHIFPHSDQSELKYIWHKIIPATVAIIITVGIVMSLLKKDFWGLISEPIQQLLELIVVVVVWILFVPISFIFNLLHNFLMSVFNPDFDGEIQRRNNQNPDPSIGEPLEGFEDVPSNIEGIQFNIIQIVEWLLISIFVAVLASMLLVVFKKIFYARSTHVMPRKESVIHDADPVQDAKILLLKLLPNWMKTRRIGKTPIYVDGPPGIAGPIRLYYRLLDLAEIENVVRMPNQTPNEFQRYLRTIFSNDLVRMATVAFNQAFYGKCSIPDEDLSVIKSKIDTSMDDFLR